MSASLRIAVGGMAAGDPGQGGATWAVLEYVLGFRRLGHDVLLIEPARNIATSYFDDVARAFDLAGRAALVREGTRETHGMTYAEIERFARSADLLINISGMLTDQNLISNIPLRVYLDLDPVFVQLWHATQGIDMRLAGHTHFVTVGQAIGEPGCPVPDCGVRWIKTLPPVVLEHWPMATRVEHDALTTVANWRGYGSIEHKGVTYGQKAHSLRALINLPRLTDKAFLLALSIHPDERRDLAALAQNGWQLADPMVVAGTPSRYRQFIQGSWGEFGIAKSGYVHGRCGWFSDRSACYLASGRPVIAQDTGFAPYLPVGDGLFAFTTAEDVVCAINNIQGDYAHHARRARELAESHFDSDAVLRRLLAEVGCA